MKVNITSRKSIKPVSPTPVHLKEFHLSLLDQLTPNFYGLIVLFYDPPTQNVDVSEISLRLQNSLSLTLTFFYPMAGRVRGSASVDCNDEGAYYVEAHIDCNLWEFLTRPDIRILDQFLPTSDPKLAELASNAILLVQFTAFRCGGTAISVCNSHKIGDIASLVTMLKTWTSISREPESDESVTKPVFVGGSLIPANEKLPNVLPGNLPSGNWVTKRFVFSGSAIANLRSQIDASFTPSRVETVLALIWKCASSSSKRKAKSVLFQAVNLRTRMQPPLPEISVGNLIWPVPVILEEEEAKENEPHLHKMVGKMREAITEFCNEKANRFKGEEGFLEVTGSLKQRREKMKDMETYRCTSWCKFPLYETDFGWGKPRWVSSAGLSFKNTIVLVDTKEADGIEAWVTLEEDDMAVFQQNQELLSYASFNPSVYAV